MHVHRKLWYIYTDRECHLFKSRTVGMKNIHVYVYTQVSHPLYYIAMIKNILQFIHDFGSLQVFSNSYIHMHSGRKG